MSEKKFVDPAEYFSDRYFPGKRLIAIGVVLQLGIVFLRYSLEDRGLDDGDWLSNLFTGIYLLSLALYFLGYWKAVKGKGYPGVLFLASFTSLIGLIIIYALPDRSRGSNQG